MFYCKFRLCTTPDILTLLKASENFQKVDEGVLRILLEQPRLVSNRFYYTPVEDRTYYVITRGGRVGGRHPPFFV